MVINKRQNWLKLIGMAIRPVALFPFAAPNISKIPLQVAQHDQIEQTVAIQVHPRCTCGPAATAYTGFFRDVLKRAIRLLMIKTIPVFWPGLFWNRAG